MVCTQDGYVAVKRRKPATFGHGGPRKGVRWEAEQINAAMPELAELRASVGLRTVAAMFHLKPRNVYFRLRRNHIPFFIGPCDGPPGREVRVPLTSLKALAALIWRMPQAHPQRRGLTAARRPATR